MPKVIFPPSGKVIDVREGTSILDAAQSAEETNVACCGMAALCGLCKTTIIEGAEFLSLPCETEQRHLREEGCLEYERLGCYAEIYGDIKVQVDY